MKIVHAGDRYNEEKNNHEGDDDDEDFDDSDDVDVGKVQRPLAIGHSLFLPESKFLPQ